MAIAEIKQLIKTYFMGEIAVEALRGIDLTLEEIRGVEPLKSIGEELCDELGLDSLS